MSPEQNVYVDPFLAFFFPGHEAHKPFSGGHNGTFWGGGCKKFMLKKFMCLFCPLSAPTFPLSSRGIRFLGYFFLDFFAWNTLLTDIAPRKHDLHSAIATASASDRMENLDIRK